MLKKELNNLSEAKLLDLFYEEKNSHALGTLFNSYLPFVFATCQFYLKNREKAKDASSDVLEKMYHYFHKNRVSNAKALILISAKNHCLTLLSREKESIDIASVEYRLKEEQELDDKIRKEADLLQLEQAIEKLKPQQAQCIKLFYLEKKSYQETAQLTGLSLKQVKSDIQNGKRMLRKVLIETMNHGDE